MSGPTVLSSSNTEPGQPCVMISGMAFGLTRADVNEVNVHAVDRCHELRQSVELNLGSSPVVVSAPILDERPRLRELLCPATGH